MKGSFAGVPGFNLDGFVKSLKMPFFIIPAEARIKHF
jgi:hypothetical protein